MAGDQRARRRHADEDRARPLADRSGGLLAESSVSLVADDDRVGVGDLARVADEPLVGLDRHRAVGAVVALEQSGRDPVAVAAVAQLAVELVDQVAAVGEDEDAAGARGLDEAERGDSLAGPGGVLEPEALAGVRVLRRFAELLRVVSGRFGPVLGLLWLVVLVELLLAGDAGRGEDDISLGDRPVGAAVAVALGLGVQRGERARQRVDLGGQDGPSASAGSSWLSRRSSPSSSENVRRHATDGTFAPASISAIAASNAAVRRAGREQGRGILSLGDEWLAGELRSPARCLWMMEAWPSWPLAWSS